MVRDTSERNETVLERRIRDLIEPALVALDFELVRVGRTGPDRRTVQVMVERRDRTTMTVEHCAEASAAISEILDTADPIDDAFTLEVSSPGLDRPLTAIDHFRRFAGLDARIELGEALAGRRRFTGRLVGVADEVAGPSVILALGDQEVRLPYRLVHKAKLVMNDDLLAAAESWAACGRSP